MTDTQTPDSLRPGAIVGSWQVEGYAGRGSYGVVYRARRAGHPDSEPVALKIAVFPSDPRFQREVELLSRNPHPGIPRLLDQGRWHASPEVAHPFFVMEWIRGRPLYEWARMQNPTGREVLQVLAQVAWALEELHKGDALGVTAYRLVTGVYPPPGTQPEALKEQLKEPLPRRLSAHEFNRRVVPELAALIERLLEKECEALSGSVFKRTCYVPVLSPGRPPTSQPTHQQ